MARVRSFEQRRRHLAAHALMFALAACGAGLLAGCREPSAATPARRSFVDVEIIRDVPYGTGREQVLDLYQPKADTAAARPVLVWVHGGGFAAGNRREGPLIAFPTAFAKAGYVALSIDYRLLASEQCIEPHLESPECETAAAAAVADAQAAVRWARANASSYRLDPDRIAIAGESAGAITAAGVGTGATGPADRVRAWVAVSGAVEGGRGIDGGDAPGLLMTNADDPWIPFAWSADTAAAMRAVGVPVVLRTIEGTGHVPVDQYGDYFLAEAEAFLADHLDLAHPA